MGDLDQPRFPPEIEVQIFQFALQSNFQDVRNLILVAHRVREWLIPEIFKVIISTKEKRFPPCGLSAETFKQYGHHIRHFCVARSHNDVSSPGDPVSVAINRYIEQCPNLFDLIIGWNMPGTSIVLVGSLSNIKRFTVPSTGLLSALTYHWEAMAPNPSVQIAFPHITHLRLTYSVPDESHVQTLARHFPKMTHLAVEISSDRPATWAPRTASILRACSKLKLFIIWWHGPLRVDEVITVGLAGCDGRVVALTASYWNDWEVSARGIGMDIWELGEDVLERRRLKASHMKTVEEFQ